MFQGKTRKQKGGRVDLSFKRTRVETRIETGPPRSSTVTDASLDWVSLGPQFSVSLPLFATLEVWDVVRSLTPGQGPSDRSPLSHTSDFLRPSLVAGDHPRDPREDRPITVREHGPRQ